MASAEHLIRRLRRTALIVLILAPAASYIAPSVAKIGFFSWSDITSDPGGLLGFLVLLLNPYVGMAAIVIWLARSTTRAWILLISSLAIGGAGALMWYQLLVREDSILNVFVLLSVVSLQWIAIIATTVVILAVWMFERRSARIRSRRGV